MSAFTCRSSFASCTASFIALFSSLRFSTLRSPKAEQILDALCGGFSCTAICDWTELLKLKKTSKTPYSYACYYTIPLQVHPE